MGLRDGVAKMILTYLIIKGALGCKNPNPNPKPYPNAVSTPAAQTAVAYESVGTLTRQTLGSGGVELFTRNAIIPGCARRSQTHNGR